MGNWHFKQNAFHDLAFISTIGGFILSQAGWWFSSHNTSDFCRHSSRVMKFFDLFQPSSYEYVRLVDEEWKQTYTGAADWDAVTFPGDALRRNVTMIGHIRASLQLGN